MNGSGTCKRIKKSIYVLKSKKTNFKSNQKLKLSLKLNLEEGQLRKMTISSGVSSDSINSSNFFTAKGEFSNEFDVSQFKEHDDSGELSKRLNNMVVKPTPFYI
jgi:hypothetical protein